MSSEKITTRLVTQTFRNHWLFGDLLDHFPIKFLPTKLAVIRVYFYSKQFLLNLKNSRQLADDEKELIIVKLSREIQEIWQRASIPCYDLDTLKKHVRRLLPNVETLVKNSKLRKENDKLWIEDTLKSYDVLFDISKCKCFRPISDIGELSTITCQCPDESKISTTKLESPNEVSDLEFYIDQKVSRKYMIGWKKDVKDFRKRKRKIKAEERLAKQRENESYSNEFVNSLQGMVFS